MKTSLILMIFSSIILLIPDFCFSDNHEDINSITLKASNGDSYYQGVLGAIYRRGELGEINYAKAYDWLRLSAEQGDPIGMYNLATMFESGTFVLKDTVLANVLYDKSYAPMYELATLGNFRAQVNLGYLLEIGFGPEPGLEKAIKWYSKAAEKDYPRAQYLLGYKYYYGWGVDQDYTKARDWFTKAADNNDPAAQHILGNMYASGIGGDIDFEMAQIYFSKAEQFYTNEEITATDTSSYYLNGIEYNDDQIIAGFVPPKFLFEINEGSCGEACLWPIINSDNFIATQLQINIDGGQPGRGLHSNELHKVLDKYNIKYNDHMTRDYFEYATAFLNPARLFKSHSEKYRDYLYNIIIEKVKNGNPIILGVKIYPDEHYFWDNDHFILLVGYNEKTDELIFNDFNKRKRIKAAKLLDKTDGYSIINRYNFLNYIEILR